MRTAHRESTLAAASLLFTGLLACASRTENPNAREHVAHALSDSAAIAVATQRLDAHGDRGFSRDEAVRTRDWFTPELFQLLDRDMSDTSGVGYLNWDPFTGAQDDVGALSFYTTRTAGDTIYVGFSYMGATPLREQVSLAMRHVDGDWRIANFQYPDNTNCHRDLAVGLIRHAQSESDTCE